MSALFAGDSAPDQLTWVVGAGGLLGASVVRSQSRRGAVWSPASAISWTADAALDQIAGSTRAFLDAAAGRPWRIAWCAGAAVTNATPEALSREKALFVRLLTELQHADPSAGALFVASSAGAVYAGSAGQPFTEATPPVAISPYGVGKLGLEGAARTFHERTGTPVLVGRLSNLYGPAQNMDKPQGLISHILRSLLLRRPISIYVSLDTIRDYLFAPDAADLIVDGLDRLVGEAEAGGAPLFCTKVIASSNEITVGLLVGEVTRIAKRRPLVVYGSSATAQLQGRHLRLRSRVWTDLDRREFTSYPVGIARTLEGLSDALRRGALS